MYNKDMENLQFNKIPWSESVPTKPGFYLALPYSHGDVSKDTLSGVLISVYPEKGHLMAESDTFISWMSLKDLSKLIKWWSPRISWENTND